MPRKLFLCCFVLIFAIAEAGNVETKIAERMKEFGATAVGIYFEDPEGDVFSLN